jgi:hypothetical protein
VNPDSDSHRHQAVCNPKGKSQTALCCKHERVKLVLSPTASGLKLCPTIAVDSQRSSQARGVAVSIFATESGNGLVASLRERRKEPRQAADQLSRKSHADSSNLSGITPCSRKLATRIRFDLPPHTSDGCASPGLSRFADDPLMSRPAINFICDQAGLTLDGRRASRA